jgi:hypothetical protein
MTSARGRKGRSTAKSTRPHKWMPIVESRRPGAKALLPSSVSKKGSSDLFILQQRFDIAPESMNYI